MPRITVCLLASSCLNSAQLLEGSTREVCTIHSAQRLAVQFSPATDEERCISSSSAPSPPLFSTYMYPSAGWRILFCACYSDSKGHHRRVVCGGGLQHHHVSHGHGKRLRNIGSRKVPLPRHEFAGPPKAHHWAMGLGI